jgi:hypothetical protein
MMKKSPMRERIFHIGQEVLIASRLPNGSCAAAMVQGEEKTVLSTGLTE